MDGWMDVCMCVQACVRIFMFSSSVCVHVFMCVDVFMCVGAPAVRMCVWVQVCAAVFTCVGARARVCKGVISKHTLK